MHLFCINFMLVISIKVSPNTYPLFPFSVTYTPFSLSPVHIFPPLNIGRNLPSPPVGGGGGGAYFTKYTPLALLEHSRITGTHFGCFLLVLVDNVLAVHSSYPNEVRYRVAVIPLEILYKCPNLNEAWFSSSLGSAPFCRIGTVENIDMFQNCTAIVKHYSSTYL